MQRRQFLTSIASALTQFSTLSTTGRFQQTVEWQEATKTSIDSPEGIAVDSSGQLYIAEAYGHRVLVLDTSTGKIRPVAGGGTGRVTAGVSARSVHLNWPAALGINEKGRLWVVDHVAESVVEVDVRSGRIIKVIGGADRRRTAAVERPNAIAVTSTGEIYIADWVMGSSPPESRDHGVFRLDPDTGQLTRITGLNAPIIINPRLLFPFGLAFSSSGRFYISDYENNRILDCDPASKRVQTLANVAGPRGLALGGDTLYCTEAQPRIQAINLRTGEIRVVAGRASYGFSGDGGPATAAQMLSPFGLAVDRQGHLFISDSYDNRIRKVDARTGVITTVAGNGSPVRQDIRTIPQG